jgi:hypothetical protein
VVRRRAAWLLRWAGRHRSPAARVMPVVVTIVVIGINVGHIKSDLFPRFGPGIMRGTARLLLTAPRQLELTACQVVLLDWLASL